MAYCSKCGVEIETKRATCPLCKTKIQWHDSEPLLSALWPVQKGVPKMSTTQLRLVTIGPILLALAIAFLIVMIVDIRMNGAITWSSYPLTAIGASFVMVLGFLIFKNRWILNVGWSTVTTIAMLYLLDSFDGELLWFSEIGVPITLLVSLYGGGTLLGSDILNKQPARQLAFQMIWVTLLCLGIDYVLSDVNGERLTWSLIVAVPLMVFFALFLLLEFVVTRFINLKKYFHR